MGQEPALTAVYVGSRCVWEGMGVFADGAGDAGAGGVQWPGQTGPNGTAYGVMRAHEIGESTLWFGRSVDGIGLRCGRTYGIGSCR